MSGHIFNIQDDGTLVEMNEQPFENEDIFQTLLEKYPNLLAGDQINSGDPRRWLLVRREMGIPGEELGADRWSLDHLFLDQDAIPTLVEVKRSTDTRIRREVVGQVLDYAANAVVYWSIEQIIAEFEKQCSTDAIEPDQRLEEFLGDVQDPDEFWRAVKTNLQAGKVRMLFVADVIPPELRRIVEFLNVQMDPAEVLAVEIKHYVGTGLKTLVPRVIGQTAEAEGRKGTGNKNSIQRRANLLTIAQQQGVGELLSQCIQNLEPLFRRSGATKSTITFKDIVQGAKSSRSILNFEPGNSSPETGLRYNVYVDRLTELCKCDKLEVVAALPNCQKEEQLDGPYGEYREGYFKSIEELSPLLGLLKKSRG